MPKNLAMLAVAAGLATLAASPALAFSASFRWCSGSPAFTLNAVPKGATSLRFNMVDQQAPAYRHGGGTVAYTGQKGVPCGALGSYVGPSPPPPQVHTYEFTIDALDASGSVIGTAKARRKFPEWRCPEPFAA